MKIVENRSYLVVSPKKAFVDWVNSIDDDPLPEDYVLQNRTVYLVDELDSTEEKDVERLKKAYFLEIFNNELSSYYTDENLFPESPDYNLFCEWFDCLYIDMGFDLPDDEIEVWEE